MRKPTRRGVLALSACLAAPLLALLAATPAAAQEVIGPWHGVLTIGPNVLRVVVHVKADPKGGYTGDLVSPDQTPQPFPISDIKFEGDHFAFAIPVIGGSFDAHWDAAKQSWAGQFTQGGTIPLILAKGDLPPTPPGAGAQAPALPPAQLAWWTGYLAHSQLVRLPDGRQMNLYCEGQGAPVVVMDAGLGDGSWTWASVQDQIAPKTRVCAFDHAGFGRSSPGPSPRDTKAIVADLAQTLKAAHVPGPYVLVGHSAGSYNVRLFALTRPREVAGMVLIDPSVDNQIPRMSAIAPQVRTQAVAQYDALKPCAETPRPPERVAACVGVLPATIPADIRAFVAEARRPEYYAAIRAETEALGNFDSEELIAAKAAAGATPLGAKPLIVLTAGATPRPGLTPDQAAAVQKLWVAMHDELAALSSRGVNRLVPDAVHGIHVQKPQLVVDTVAEVVDAARVASR